MKRRKFVLLSLTVAVLPLMYFFIWPLLMSEQQAAISNNLYALRKHGNFFYTDEKVRSIDLLRRCYDLRQNNPIWINDEKELSAQALVLLDSIANAANEGLQPEDYHYSALRQWLGFSRNFKLTHTSADSIAEFDLLLSDAFLSYVSEKYAGKVPAVDNLNRSRAQKLKTANLENALPDAVVNNNLTSVLKKYSCNYNDYRNLRSRLATYNKLMQLNLWPQLPPKTYLKPGDVNDFVPVLYMALQTTGFVTYTGSGKNTFDDNLKYGLIAYQNAYGLEPTGRVDTPTLQSLRIPVNERIRQIEMNMERWRWLPNIKADTNVVVNIAGFQLQVKKRDAEILKMKIIVGKPFQQTPIFFADMKYMVINPYWDVPHSIATKEILPILKRNPGYLYKEHMKLYTTGGAEVNPYAVNWSRVSASGFYFHIRQLPGDWNALGRIKFIFPNPYNVYLHGTPHKNLFNARVRSFSHGCMRVERPLDMAELLFARTAWDRSQIESTISTQKETHVILKKKLPVFVTYQTAWVDETTHKLFFRDDIYGVDHKMMRYFPLKKPIFI